MKTHSRFVFKSSTFLIPLSMGLLSMSANAALLLYEPFDYTTGNIATQGGAETGFDASSTWTENSGHTTEISTGSMSFGSLATAGNAFHYSITGAYEYNQYASRPLDVTASSGDVYMTFLMQGPNGLRLNGGAYINGSSLQEFGALRTQYNTDTDVNASPNTPHVYYAGQSAVPSPVANPVTATTYMYVQKYTGLGTASGGTAQLWLIDSSDYDTITADGNVTTAELDANNALSTEVLTLAGAASTLDGTETLRLHAHDNGSGDTDYTLDEVRIATTLNEAMDLTLVPEPSSTALLGLGGLALMLRRRK